MINIELTEAEALLFKQFREYQDRFKLLIDNGVFNTRNGTATLNFDAAGTLTQIDLNIVTFKKGYPHLTVFHI